MALEFLHGSAEVFFRRRAGELDLQVGRAHLRLQPNRDREAHMLVESNPRDLGEGQRHMARVRVVQGRLSCCQPDSTSMLAGSGQILHVDPVLARAVSYPVAPAR